MSQVNATVSTNTAPTFIKAGDGTVAHVLVPLGVGAWNNGFGGGHSAILQTDGKILVAEKTWNNSIRLVRYNSDGTLDLSFDGNSKIDIHVNSDSFAHNLTLQADGKILLAGASIKDIHFALVRYNSDGSLDNSFDGDGKVTTALGPNADAGQSVTVQTDGKILVAGITLNGSNSHYPFAIVRYNNDSSLDTSFDGDGKVTTDLGLNFDKARFVIAQTDAKVLLAVLGTNSNVGPFGDLALIRYNNDGSLDTSFDGDGKIITALGYSGTALTLQVDGKILVSGSVSNGDNLDFVLTRYNSDGSLDSSFNGAGKVTTDFGSFDDSGYSVTVQSDGKILVAGISQKFETSGDFNQTLSLARYNSDGSLDSSFDGDGKVTTSIDGYSPVYGISAIVQTDGKIVISGAFTRGDYDFTLVRYNPDGSLDTTFGSANSLNGTPGYIVKGAAVVLDSTVKIYDAELAAQGHYAGASITLVRHDGANNQDVFSGSGNLIFTTSDAILSGVTIGTVSNSNGTLIINFNSNATQERINEALSSLAYSNTSNNPISSQQIDWIFNDGNTGTQGTGGALSALGSTTFNSPLATPTAINFIDTAFDDSFATYLESLVGSTTTFTYGISEGTDNNDDGYITKTSAYGVLQVQKATGVYYFMGNDEAIEALKENTSIDFTVTASDGVFSDSTTLTINITQSGNTESLGNDKLIGTSGNDSFDGLAGADIMKGGLGDDTYTVESKGDVVIEGAKAGNDTVISSITYTLKANVENLSLTGTVAINGTGNSLSNILTGNAEANILNGGAGADSLNGNAGDDILDGGLGNDVLTGGDGQDIFKLMNRSKDTITDFSVADDTIQLENSLFKKLITSDVLNANNFKVGTAATDADDYVIYNSDTGALYYDANGNGTGGATQIALLGVHLALANANFAVI